MNCLFLEPDVWCFGCPCFTPLCSGSELCILWVCINLYSLFLFSRVTLLPPQDIPNQFSAFLNYPISQILNEHLTMSKTCQAKNKGDEKCYGVTVFISKLKYCHQYFSGDICFTQTSKRQILFIWRELFVFLSLLVNDCYFSCSLGNLQTPGILFSFPLGDSMFPLDFFSSISANCMQKGNLASDYLDMILIIYTCDTTLNISKVYSFDFCIFYVVWMDTYADIYTDFICLEC